MDPEKAIKELKQLEKFSDRAKGRGMRLAAEGWDSDFQTLIAIIMSARTLDETTVATAKKLFEKYPNAKSLSKASKEEVEKIIISVNFYQNKSRYIIECAKELMKKYDGGVPHDINKLVELPGVGRKTANVFLAEHGIEAIGVDTHLAYVSQKLDWTKNKNPEKIEKDLQELFPKRLWRCLNEITVRFGKSYTNRKVQDKILEEIRKEK